MNYEADIEINETELDVEWLDQPALMMRYARYLADVKMAFDKVKERLELVKAELDKVIRTNPERFDIEKITDKVVENTIPMQATYKEASEALINAKYEMEMTYGAVKAIDARRDALENLVRLHGQQYFAGPQEPRDLHWERDKKRARVNEKIATKIKRTK